MLKKFEFNKDTMEFLGYIIPPEGLTIDLCKVVTTSDWAASKGVCGMQQFLGVGNFYQQFIEGFCSLVASIMAVLKRVIQFTWSMETQLAFD